MQIGFFLFVHPLFRRSHKNANSFLIPRNFTRIFFFALFLPCPGTKLVPCPVMGNHVFFALLGRELYLHSGLYFSCRFLIKYKHALLRVHESEYFMKKNKGVCELCLLLVYIYTSDIVGRCVCVVNCVE